MAIDHTHEQAEIQPGRVYMVKASDSIVYKALVWEALANGLYLVEFLEPLEKKDAAKFQLGDCDDEVQTENIIGPYIFSREDGTESNYLAANISHKAEVSVEGVELQIGGLSESGTQDFGEYGYTLVLTDPERLGDKRIEINVFVPIEGLRREVRTEQSRKKDPADVSCACWYD